MATTALSAAKSRGGVGANTSADQTGSPLIQYLERRYWQLAQRYEEDWAERHREIAATFHPPSGMDLDGSTDSAHDVLSLQVTSEPRMAHRILTLGLKEGICPESRAFFRFAARPDPVTGDPAPHDRDVRASRLTRQVLEVCSSSDFYPAMDQVFDRLSLFGTAAAIVWDDFENVIHVETLTQGSYAIGTDSKGRVTTMVRTIDRTLEQLATDFDVDRLPLHLQEEHRQRRNLDVRHPVFHALLPNDRAINWDTPQEWRYRSVWWMSGSERPLRSSGFDEQRILCPRWSLPTRTNEGWGLGPCDDAINDCRELRQQILKRGQAIDTLIRPPLQGPALAGMAQPTIIPGSYTSVPAIGDGVRPIYAGAISIAELQQVINELTQAIRSALFVDLFTQMLSTDRREITAREVDERAAEKALLLGPVFARTNNEMLGVIISVIVARLAAAGALANDGAEDDEEYELQYLGFLAQAARALETLVIEQAARFNASMATIDRRAQYLMDGVAAARRYASSLGLHFDIMRSDEAIDQMMAEEQRAMQQQQGMEQLKLATESAKNLGQANLTPETALGAIGQGAGVLAAG